MQLLWPLFQAQAIKPNLNVLLYYYFGKQLFLSLAYLTLALESIYVANLLQFLTPH